MSSSQSQDPVLGALLGQGNLGVAWLDEHGRFRHVNERLCAMLGYGESELLSRSDCQVTHPEDLVASMALGAQLVGGARSGCTHSKRYVHKSGRTLWADVSLSVVQQAEPRGTSLLMLVQDVTERKRQDLQAADERQVLERLASGGALQDALQAIVRLYGCYSQRSGRVALYRLSDDETTLAPFAVSTAMGAYNEELRELWIAPDGSLSARAAYHRKIQTCTNCAGQPDLFISGEEGPVADVRNAFSLPILNMAGALLGVFTVYESTRGAATDEDLRLAEQLARLAAIALQKETGMRAIVHRHTHDSLTDLPNRDLLVRHLRQGLRKAEREQKAVALLMVDISGMHRVTDTFGHDVADRLLLALAARLREFLDGVGTLARPGSDEFAILLDAVADQRAALRFARDCLRCLNAPLRVGDEDIAVTANIGVALAERDHEGAAALLRQAESALTQARSEGANSIRVHAGKVATRSPRKLVLAADLHRALERNEFIVHYQPQVELEHGRIVGAEALLRWQHPTRGVVSPLEFIPLLEESGLINQVGAWVMEEVAGKLASLRDAPWGVPQISVNLSPRQFHDAKLVSIVRGILQRHRLAPRSLVLELTESLVMRDDAETRAACTALRELGVGLSVDDFGTGCSGLSYLKRLPLDALKIDKRFVDEIVANKTDSTIVSGIIMMAHNLGLRVVAEGVESVEQLDFLRLKACDQIQGYLFSRPVPFTDLCAQLAQDRRLRLTPPVMPPVPAYAARV
ncbi:MAG TPA: EAL domain-containing protein [Steroidobacteraceae bacterium]|nr:EAL domain-containing protein [Steroidobacteraceae bacterium]